MIDRNNLNYVLLIIIIALILLIIYKLFIEEVQCVDHMINIENIKNPSWSQNTCNYLLGDTLETILKDNNIIKMENNAKITLPCDYDDQDKEIDMMKPIHSDQQFFIIGNADLMTAKEELWRNVLYHHGYDKTKSMMPITYILDDINDLNRLKLEYKQNNIYIMKKNIQRQEGLKITNKLDEILNGKNEGYIIAQELLQDPYIIDDRKINMRFYVLVICKENKMDVYVYNDGFMYYTDGAFIKGSTETKPNITTGYIDRSVYEKNPLTHEDFRKYLDDNTRQLSNPELHITRQHLKLSNIIFDRIFDLLKNVFVSFFGKVCNKPKLKPYVSFQLFGVDIAINDQLNPMIMEINKGPDMGAKDERDKALKHRCMKDVFKLVGAINDNHVEFKKILELESK
jgi:hypothetical protein